MESEVVESFKDSWLASSDESFASRMARKSLEVLASDVPEFGAALKELKKPVQEQLDLHLDGPEVVGHATSAAALGKLYIGLAEAAKEIAKTISGRQRYPSTLVALAPSVGSVRVVVQAPHEDRQQSLDGLNIGTVDERALRTVAQLMVTAENASPTLEASAQALSRQSRKALREVAETVRDSSWVVCGELVARDRETIQIKLTSEGAQRLAKAASATDQSSDHVRMKGELDGFIWSTGTMRFIPSAGRPFSAAVPPQLQPKVADLLAGKATGVDARFLRTTAFPSGSTRPSHTSYALISI